MLISLTLRKCVFGIPTSIYAHEERIRRGGRLDELENCECLGEWCGPGGLNQGANII